MVEQSAQEPVTDAHDGPASGASGPGWVPCQRLDVPLGEVGSGLTEQASRSAEMLVVTHATELMEVCGGDEELLERVLSKLETEPVEDLRVDLTGRLAEPEVKAAAAALDEIQASAKPARRVGIRLPATGAGEATTVIAAFVTALASGDRAAPSMAVTLASAAPDLVAVVAGELDRLEEEIGLPPGRVRLELELADRTQLLEPGTLVAAAGPRLCSIFVDRAGLVAALGAVPGIDDAAVGGLLTPLRVIAAETGVALGDLGVAGDGEHPERCWQRLAEESTRALGDGLLIGRDDEAGALPSRYAAAFSFYRAGLERVGRRLRDGVGDLRPAAGFLRRGLDCGALAADEVERTAGVSHADLVRIAGQRPA